MSNNEKPLFGRRIVITRAPEQSQEFRLLLEEKGAQVLCTALVAFDDPDDFAPLDAAIRRLSDFDWLIFTSQNAVRYFVKRFLALEADETLLQRETLRVAAVGPATAEEAKRNEISVSLVARAHRGEALAQELGPENSGKKILIPRSDRAASDLPEALRALGARVTDVVAYRTLSPDASNDAMQRILRAEVDIITFASPSAFRNLELLLGDSELRNIAFRTSFAAIGPVTAAAIRKSGYTVEIEASESTSAGLVKAIVDYCLQRSSSGVIRK